MRGDYITNSQLPEITNDLSIGVLGLGYVGFPLALEINGFQIYHH